jgi:spore coat protein U-like protein
MKRLLAFLLAAASIPCAADQRPHDQRDFHGHCSVAAVNLTFGSYNPFRVGHTDTTGNIAITCAGKPGDRVAYSIMLNAGRSGSFAQRRMHSHTARPLNYNIYTSASRTLVWGDGHNGTSVVADAFTQEAGRATRNYPVYGRVFGGQNAYVGTYVDSIVVTVNF